MNKRPLVSVFMPAFNHEQYVEEAIQSVIDLDYTNLEFIIIDDGSTDKTHSIIKTLLPKCQERFVRFEYRSRENRGLTQTLNECLDWSTGEYYMPLASDDITLPDRINQLLPILENDSKTAAVFGSLIQIDSDGKFLKNVLRNCTHTFEDLLMQKNIPLAPGSLIRKKSVLNVGKYNPKIRIEDWYLWLKLTENNQATLRSLPVYVAKYRQHTNNTTNNWRFMYKHGRLTINEFSYHPLASKALANKHLVATIRAVECYDIKLALFFWKKVKADTALSKVRCMAIYLLPRLWLRLKRKLRGD